MINHHPPSKFQQKIRDTLERAGERSLGAEAITKPKTEVRKAGLKRLGGHAVASVVAAGSLAGATVGISNASARENEFYRNQNRERQEQIANNAPEPTMPHVTHPVQAGENPWTIADQYTGWPQDTQDLANDIQDQLADESGNIHPNQVAKITPDPNRNR